MIKSLDDMECKYWHALRYADFQTVDSYDLKNLPLVSFVTPESLRPRGRQKGTFQST